MLNQWTDACKQFVAEGWATARLQARSWVTAEHALPAWRTLVKARRRSLKSIPRLQQLYELARQVDRQAVEGDFVECGVYRGGSAMILADAMLHSATARQLWLFDSFRGLPKPSAVDGPLAKAEEGQLRASVADVSQAVAGTGVDTGRIQVVAGWFSETLPAAPLHRVALAHIDSDWYESVKLCLNCLFPTLSPGGIILLDDYYDWPGCRAAADEFLAQHAGDAEPTLLRGLPLYLRRRLRS